MRDPVCGMDVDPATAEREGLWEDYGETRYVFCAPSCRQVFAMDPNRFVGQHRSGETVGHCDLCRKAIHEGEDAPSLALGAHTYRFCCSTCATVFLGRFPLRAPDAATDPVSQASSVRERLLRCGLLPWLEEAVRQRASDLFLSVADPPTLRVHGALEALAPTPLTAQQLTEFVSVLVPEAKRAQLLEGREVDAGLEVEGLARFRINVFREQDGHAIALRPLPHRIPPLAELGLPPIFESLSRCPRGLILITGPAGSGKTTTLFSLIDAINVREQRHIVTIEDPIEYVVPNKLSLIHQRELDAHTRTFADGLRSALREHPDVIVVGELRDRESIALAITAAETGHLVLGTLHSGTTVQAITRILDVFEAGLQGQIRTQLAQSLQAIVAQRLLPRRDGSGVLAATEVLIATQAVRNVIRRDALHELPGYVESGAHEGMHTLERSIKRLVEQGVVGDEALREAASSLVRSAAPDGEPRKRSRGRRWFGG